MKFAFISESPADNAALRAFCETLIGGHPIECVESLVRIPGGWTEVIKKLPPALRALRYGTDADVVVVSIDSDSTDLTPGSSTNRLDLLKEIIKKNLSPRSPADRNLRAISGIAVPAIEAWWLAHNHSDISEIAWLERKKQRPAYDKLELKRRLYGTERPSISLETDRMVCAAREAARHPDELCKKFPQGLASLVREIQALARVATSASSATAASASPAG
jgi:hypothetical protein